MEVGDRAALSKLAILTQIDSFSSTKCRPVRIATASRSAMPVAAAALGNCSNRWNRRRFGGRSWSGTTCLWSEASSSRTCPMPWSIESVSLVQGFSRRVKGDSRK